MRLSSTLLFAAAVLLQPSMSHAQAPAPAPAEGNRAVADGGVFVPGWSGKVDATAESSGESVKNAKLTKDGDVLHVMTGPAVTYWNPANTASGNYTVKATFTEPKYMNLNDHPHPYGIVIAGNDLGTPQQSYLYCAANGNGSFIVRGFSPEPFQLNGRRAEANPAVHKAAGQGSPANRILSLAVHPSRLRSRILSPAMHLRIAAREASRSTTAPPLHPTKWSPRQSRPAG